MPLQTQITDDLTTAMKNAAIDAGRGPRGELDDDEVARLVQSEVKRRREAAEAFRTGGRDESADKEDYEAEVYQAYLPTQLSDEELQTIVDGAIAEVGATDRSSMGQVMKVVMGRVGSRADGKRVSGMVGPKLS